ncbi:hypothetical protein KAR91_27670 [Candidatus Pacearchaeota archaeon]|nr:hypothetical protein [Candidatus Pacearchaeota archaeon]
MTLLIPKKIVKHYGKAFLKQLNGQIIKPEVFKNLKFVTRVPVMKNAEPINIINIAEPEKLEKYLNSPEGERTLLNLIKGPEK